VKEFLSREGVEFTAKDVDEDAAAYGELIARGFRAVPVTMFGDRAVAGFNPVTLRDALAEYRAGR
jgi:glutaredoxin